MAGVDEAEDPEAVATGFWSASDSGPSVEGVESLFRSEYARLLRLATLLVDDRWTAEELVQEAFLQLFKHRTHVNSEAASFYLRAAVINLSRSRLRRIAVSRRAHRQMTSEPDRVDDGIETADHDRAVLDAIRALPRRQRECVALRYYLDLSEAEIAVTLGITAGTVKSHTHRARQSLARTLEETDDD
jgi:RNA polymerase sigma-70 factor (sigma-E family)